MPPYVFLNVDGREERGVLFFFHFHDIIIVCFVQTYFILLPFTSIIFYKMLMGSEKEMVFFNVFIFPSCSIVHGK